MWDRNLISGNPKSAVSVSDQGQKLLFESPKKRQLVRIYHHYEKWEEFHAGMWRGLEGAEAKKLLKEAIAFTGNALLYGSFMRRVISEWPISCENSLTCVALNRQAWLGHAACCLAIGCPEHVTREAWHYLTEQQREDANEQAAEAITLWENAYLRG